MRLKTKKDVEKIIQKAFEIDNSLPNVKPSSYHSLLGKLIIIPDDERSADDVLEDLNHFKQQVLTEDYDLWFAVMSAFLTELSPIERKIAELRAKRKGWKSISKKLKELSLSERELHRSTLWRFYDDALEKLLKTDINTSKNAKSVIIPKR